MPHRQQQNGAQKLFHLIKQTLTALALAALLLPSYAAAQPKETTKATFGDWEIRCPPEDSDRCVMVQIGKTDNGENAIEIRVSKLEDAKTRDEKAMPAVARIVTLFRAVTIVRLGLRVKVDSAEERLAPYRFCLRSGCVARFPLSEDFLTMLKVGNIMAVTFAMLKQGEVTATVSLRGFTKAFKSL